MKTQRTKSMFRAAAAAAVFAVAIAGGAFALRAQSASSPELADILKGLAAFDGGIDSAAYWKLHAYIHAKANDPAGRAECEAGLLEFLGGPAKPFAKFSAARFLRLVGGEKSIPVLISWLKDPAAADVALLALSGQTGPAVERALLQALASSAGPVRMSILAQLADRRSLEAVPVIARQLASSDSTVGAAAASALGRIGGREAVQALLAALPGASAAGKGPIASALLVCAEKALAAGKAADALRVYETLRAARLPAPILLAAESGRLAAAGDQAPRLILYILSKESTAEETAAAIGAVRAAFSPAGIGPVAALLPRLKEGPQIQLLTVLSAYPKESVLEPVLRAAENGAPPVRIAALKTLEAVGDETCVGILAETAARTRGAEQAAARAALAGLKGKDCDAIIMNYLLKDVADNFRAELLQAAAERKIFAAKAMAAAMTNSTSSSVRRQALRVLRAIGTPSDIPALLEKMLGGGDDVERSEILATVTALAQKIAGPESRAAAVKTRLAQEKDPLKRAALFEVLGRIGDGSSLAVLRAGLADAQTVDAAVRALSAWPTPAALDDVRAIAAGSKDETHRLLALRGLIRMIGLDKYRKPEAAAADLKAALALASRPEEKKLVLGVLPGFVCADSLALAETLLGDADVKEEAKAAVDKLKAALGKK